jgi:hypothetical protein
MVDGHHTLVQNRTMKPLAIVVSRAGRGLRGSDSKGDVANV